MHVINLCAHELTGLDNQVGRVWQNSGISSNVTSDAKIQIYVSGKLYQESGTFRQYLRDMGLFSNSLNFDISAKPGYKYDRYEQVEATLKVYYTPYTYTIKFNGNGSTSGSMSNLSMTYGTRKNLTANAFKKVYTVSFNGNGGTAGQSSLTSSATFNGWEDRSTYKYPEDSSDWTYGQFDAPFYLNAHEDLFTNLISPAYGGVKVYDKYMLLKHYVNYGKTELRPAVGASPGLYPDKAAVNNLSSTDKGTVNLYANWSQMPAVTLPSASKASSTFLGWYTAATGGTRVGGAGDSYTPSGSVTLYAQYETNHTVTGSISNGTVTNGNQSVVHGSNNAEMVFSSNTNYVITKVTENGTSIFNADTADKALQSTSYTYGARAITENKAVVATTAAVYSVSFNGNGNSSGSMSDQPCVYGYTHNLTSNAFKKQYTVSYDANYTGAAPVAPSYSEVGFSKWGTTVSGGTTYDDGSSVKNLSSTAGGKVNLYALWKSEGKSITLPELTREGYVFDGWYTAASGGTLAGKGGESYTPSSDVTLYAHYTASNCSLTITETGLGADDNAIITVTRSGEPVPLYTVLVGGSSNSVTIRDLLEGRYVVVCLDWNMAYVVSTALVEKEIRSTETVTFEFTEKATTPVHSENIKVNW